MKSWKRRRVYRIVSNVQRPTFVEEIEVTWLVNIIKRVRVRVSRVYNAVQNGDGGSGSGSSSNTNARL